MSAGVRLATMLVVLGAGWWWLTPRTAERPTASVQFAESADAAGCRNVHSKPFLHDSFTNIMPWLTSVGAAVAAGDYDADGDPDLYVTNSGRGDYNRLFRNRGDGTFEDVTESVGVGCGNPSGASMHAVWGDVDNDGDPDLYVVKWAEPNTLFRNNGDGTFTDIATDAGVDYWGYGNGATFLDFDRDGRLDLFVANYFPEKVTDPATGELVRNNLWQPVTTRVMHETFTHASNGGRNLLFQNRGDGTFGEVSGDVGITHTGWSLAVGSGDLNNDGWPDIYVANDFGPDELYFNTGATQDPAAFRLIVDPRGHPGVGRDWWKGMNVDMGDVNNDGQLDIYVTNILERRYKTDEGNMLWLNCEDLASPGGRSFKNVALISGTFDGGWGWAGKFADFNNDGLLDIYTVNGFVTGSPERNYWFQIQEMVTQTKNQTADTRVWPAMEDRDLSGHERGRLFVQLSHAQAETGQAPMSNDARPVPTAIGERVPRFAEVSAQSGITDTYNGRGIAVADFNGDGRLDMYVANQGAPATYYVNKGPAEAGIDGQRLEPFGFLRLNLVGRPDAPQRVGARSFACTRDAVGARVTLFARDGEQHREVQGGMGFASQSEHTVHFGVPSPEKLGSIFIRWPSGRSQFIKKDSIQDMLNKETRIEEPVEELVRR